MSEVGPVEPRAATQRHYGGWVALAVMFIVVAGVELASSLTRTPSAFTRYEESRTEIQQAVISEQMSSSVGMGGMAQAQAQQSLATTAARLKPHLSADKETERLYAVALTELHRPVPPGSLALLASSPRPADQAFAQIYKSDRLSEPAARELARTVGGATFEAKMASVQALEKANVPGARSSRLRPVAISYFIVIGGAVALLGAGLLIWVIYIGLRLSGELKPLGPPLGKLSPQDADRVAIRAAQLFGTFIALNLALLAIGPKQLDDRALLLIQAVVMVAAVIVFARIPVLGKTISLKDLGFTTDHLASKIGWAIGAYAANIPLMLILAGIGLKIFSFLPRPEHPVTAIATSSKDPLTIAVLLLTASVAAPIWEETMFRGLYFPALGRSVGLIASGAISSLVFAAIHPTGVAVWLALGSIGAVSCALSCHTRSLVPSIIMHGLHNTTLLVASMLIS